MFKFLFREPRLNFAPALREDDELLRSIAETPLAGRDDAWKLQDDVDPTELDAFWDRTLKELEGPDK